jgi:hypothetical protein
VKSPNQVGDGPGRCQFCGCWGRCTWLVTRLPVASGSRADRGSDGVGPGDDPAVGPRGSNSSRVDLMGGSPDAAHNNFPQRRVQLTTDACYCSGSASESFCSTARRAWPRIQLPTPARRSAPAARRTVVPARCRSQPGVQRPIGRGQYPTMRSPSSYHRHPAGGSIQLRLSEFGQRVQTIAEQCTHLLGGHRVAGVRPSIPSSPEPIHTPGVSLCSV